MIERKRRSDAFQAQGRCGLRQAVQRVEELSAEEHFRQVIKAMADASPVLRSTVTNLETRWDAFDAEGRQFIWSAEAALRRLLAAGSPQPKNVFDKIWAGFTDDVRVTLWEFAAASRAFLSAVDAIVTSNDQSHWERAAFNNPALSAMHQRSVAALEAGTKPILHDVEELRQKHLQ